MNIFPINRDPRLCAKWACDQHVVKIISEAVLMYSSALHYKYKDIWNKIPKEDKYGPIKIPLVTWAMNDLNRTWLCYYIYELNKEYEYRYNHKHKSYKVFLKLAETFNEIPYKDIQLKQPETFVQCMPKEFHRNDSVQAYIDYYKFKYEKGFKRPMRWTKRNKPDFLKITPM